MFLSKLLATILLRLTVLGALLAAILVPSCSAAQQQAAGQRAYEDSSGGLKRLMETVLKASTEDDQQTLAALSSSMVIPDPEAWFTKAFGQSIGTAYADKYSHEAQGFAEALVRDFNQLAATQPDSVDVTRFTSACDEKADEDAYPLLVSRKSPEPLSEVAFRRGSGGRMIRYFAFIDGAFRYAGNLEPYFNPQSTAKANTQTSGATVSVAQLQPSAQPKPNQAKILKRVSPDYPAAARRRGQQGRVAIHVIISKEGVPTNLEVVKGICIFAEPAVKAVRQWRYTPLIMEGEPREIDTTITVDFFLQ